VAIDQDVDEKVMGAFELPKGEKKRTLLRRCTNSLILPLSFDPVNLWIHSKFLSANQFQIGHLFMLQCQEKTGGS
jgi:hypothetical protein